MRHIIEPAADIASVCFFDPAALPPDFDESLKTTLVEGDQRAAHQSQIWMQDTGADGGYLFHFYVEEELPKLIQKHALEPQHIAKFQVPSGILWACGAEYAARDPLSAGLDKFGHMGGRFDVPSGVYAVTVWRTEWSDEVIEREIAKRSGKRLPRWANRLGTPIGAIFIITLLGTIGGGIKTLPLLWRGGWKPDVTWFWIGIGLAWFVLGVLFWIMNRIERNPARAEAEREFPSIVVKMNKVLASGTRASDASA